jgi:hypothetical protein
VTDDVEGAFPARSRSVVAGTNWNAPDRGVVDWEEHDPEHDPVTVNVIVRLPLLNASVPANVTVRVLPLLVR